MQIKTVSMVAAGALVLALAANSATNNNQPLDLAVAKGAQWIASVQGHDGGWGQDGGETSYVRQNEHLETNGNDVANRALAYIEREVENSPVDGLKVTNHNGTQIQRKLGPYIDTFLTSMLLSEVDGTMPTAAENARVRKALEKCVAKIEGNQQKDGSWNVGGGWAPILGTSMASRSLFEAQKKGVRVDAATVAQAENYTKEASKAPAKAAPASAGVALYQSAQALEQLSRTAKDRRENAPQIAAIRAQLQDKKFVDGYGSIGG